MCKSCANTKENVWQMLWATIGLCTESAQPLSFPALPTHVCTFFTRTFSQQKNAEISPLSAGFSTLSTPSITTTIYINNKKQVGGQEVLV